MLQVVIVGGGFAGLAVAKGLAKAPVQVTLVDQRNHHLFQPLLYQVATAALTPSDIAAPIRVVLRQQRNARVLLARAVGVDLAARQLLLDEGVLPYDFLVLATGATHSYFGHPEWEAFAPGLKTVEDATEIRRRIFLAFEAAERETDPIKRQARLTFAIVGGGPTGVELAGALAEIAHRSLLQDFRSFDPASARIVLIEGRARILPTYPPRLSQRAQKMLERLGVTIRTGLQVTDINGESVTCGDEVIPTHTVVWAAGVTASPLAQSLNVPLDRAGRVLVAPSLTIPGHDNVFVVGDLAALEQDGEPVPGVSPAAMQEGRHTALNIANAIKGQSLAAFRFRDKGQFAVIGRGAAVGLLGKRQQVSGAVAWVTWLLVHIFYLIGFRNRAVVLFEWAYSYLTFRKGARLITGTTLPPLPAIGEPRSRP